MIDIKEMFPFELDSFQLDSIEAIKNGRSVIVCAPTGSGKTVIAEYAVKLALSRGHRCFYTTPLKALSNQKFGDLRRVYGEDNVGLLTGDVSVNRNAAIVVMTTEVYRNMLYGTILGDVRDNLTHVESVVIDECHYMNDPDRGTVWEELVIYSPPEVQLIALSATVANAQELQAWFEEVHGPTELVQSSYRPVPLRHHYYYDGAVYRLLMPNERINPKLRAMVHPVDVSSTRNRRTESNNEPMKKQDYPEKVVGALDKKGMLPAIYFLFSRRKCDEAARHSDRAVTLTPEHQRLLNKAVDAALDEHPALRDNPGVPHLRAGIAAHHAGLLPLWKVLVENLFQQGLLKVVYATETLAAGINMPAKTTVISAISKYSDEGLRKMTASEFLQMSGRAGRRGMDEIGHVVVVNHPMEPVEDAAALARASADPLVSRFTPGYGMVLNLLQNHSPAEAQDLIERSFGQFVANQSHGPLLERVEEYRQQVEMLRQPLCGKNAAPVEPSSAEDGQNQDNLDLPSSAVACGDSANCLSEMSVQVDSPSHEPSLESEPGQPEQANSAAPVVIGNLNVWRKANRKLVDLGRKIKTLAARESLSAYEDSLLAEFRQRREELYTEVHSMPCQACRYRNECNDNAKQLRQVEKRCAEVEKRLRQTDTSYWAQFQNLEKVLEVAGYVREHKPTWEGELAASLRTVNVLFLSEVALSGVLNELEPAEVAGVLSAVVLGDSHSAPEIAMRPSRESERVIEDICRIAADVEALQDKYNVNTPLLINSTFSGLIEFWCRNADWEHVRNYLGWDEGDLIRTMRRTLDVLRQFEHAPGIPSRVADLCQKAELLLDRDEVHEAVLWAD